MTSISATQQPAPAWGLPVAPDKLQKHTVNTTDAQGNTPLHLACRDALEQETARFLRLGGNPNALNALHATPLHFAAKFCPGSVFALLANEANPNIHDHRGQSPLHIAAAAAHNRSVAALIEYGCKVDHRDFRDQTALHLAAEACATEAIGLLIDNGADVNAADQAGNTPLHRLLMAASFYQFSASEISSALNALLAAKAQVNYTNKAGEAPLLIAAKHNLPAETLNCLIRYRAKPDFADAEGMTPLFHACINTNARNVATLIDAGASLEARDASGKTPLLVACQTGAMHAMEKLIEAGASLDVACRINDDDYGALHLASAEGRQHILQALIEHHHVNPGETTRMGRSAAELASTFPKVADYLKGKIDALAAPTSSPMKLAA